MSSELDININPEHKGLFKKYCKRVTGSDEVTIVCIEKGLKSKDPKIRKRAVFAKNARKWRKKPDKG